MFHDGIGYKQREELNTIRVFFSRRNMFAFGAYLLSAIVVDALFVIDLLKVGRDRKSAFGPNESRAKPHSCSELAAVCAR